MALGDVVQEIADAEIRRLEWLRWALTNSIPADESWRQRTGEWVSMRPPEPKSGVMRRAMTRIRAALVGGPS